MLPRPYPDEWIGSVLARAVIRSGLSGKKLVAHITGVERSSMSYFLPGDVAGLAAVIGLRPRGLLWQHTAFPYVTSHMAATEADRLEAKILGRLRPVSECLGSLTKSITYGLQSLRYCATCLAEDLAQYGEGYWHRAHCLPLTWMCPVHVEHLYVSGIPSNLVNRRFASGLSECWRGEQVEWRLAPEVLIDLARMSAGALGPRTRGSAMPQGQYREMAFSKGYEQAGRRLASSQLAMDLAAFYGSDFLYEVGCSVGNPLKSWPAAMVRDHVGGPYAPSKHLLLQAFLHHSDDLPKRTTYRPPGMTPVDRTALDLELAERVREIVLQGETGDARTTAMAILKKAGAWQMYRHHRSSFPRTGEVLESFRSSPFAARKKASVCRRGDRRATAPVLMDRVEP